MSHVNAYEPGAANVYEKLPVSEMFDAKPGPETSCCSPVAHVHVTDPPAAMVTAEGLQRCAAVARTVALEGAPAGVGVGGTGVGGTAVGGTGVGAGGWLPGVAVGGTDCVGGAAVGLAAAVAVAEAGEVAVAAVVGETPTVALAPAAGEAEAAAVVAVRVAVAVAAGAALALSSSPPPQAPSASAAATIAAANIKMRIVFRSLPNSYVPARPARCPARLARLSAHAATALRIFRSIPAGRDRASPGFALRPSAEPPPPDATITGRPPGLPRPRRALQPRNRREPGQAAKALFAAR